MLVIGPSQCNQRAANRIEPSQCNLATDNPNHIIIIILCKPQEEYKAQIN